MGLRVPAPVTPFSCPRQVDPGLGVNSNKVAFNQTSRRL